MASLQRTVDAVYEDFQPKLESTETPEAHILRIHLPGFTRDQVRIRYVSPTKVLSISGEKPDGDNKWSRFNESIPISENCEVNKLSANFDKGILTITMPKKFITPAVPKQELRPSEEEIFQKSSLDAAYEEFQPKVEKTENMDAYLLQVYLAGFSKDQIKIKYISTSRVVSISGERPIEGGKRWIHFDQAFPIPANFNEERLGAKFDKGILTITIPKKLTSLVGPKEEVAMTEPKPQRAEEEIHPKPMTGVEGLKRSSSHFSLEEIDKKGSLGAVYEEFQPKSQITENFEAYHIQIELPGFAKDQVKTKYISSSRVMSIFGERPIEGGNKWIRVDQAYPVPENFDTEKVQGKFDQGILTITVPKKFTPQLLAPKEELKITQDKFPSPPQKHSTTPSLEEARDKRSIASLPTFPQKGKQEVVPKPTRSALIDEQAAPRTASVEEKRIEYLVDIVGKGIQEVAASASSSVSNLADGTLNNEEKYLLAVVIAALGAYVSYRSTASKKPYNY